MNIHPAVLAMAMLLIAGILFFAYRFATLGFKGTFFGGSISRSHGPIPLAMTTHISASIHVHEVRIRQKVFIGIEISYKGKTSYGMQALLFTKNDIHKLTNVLKQISSEKRTE